VDVTGRDLRAALENGLSQLPRGGGRFPQVSGISLEVDISKPPGSRILSMKVGDLPLDETRTYKVAINDFMARGGDGYVQFANAHRALAAEDSPLLANQVMVYLRQLGTVQIATGNRIVVK
jgi:2',3'-cyclic-nucleotide 2'-phosphodiesterase (5'-nucleotidase family)